MNAANPTLPGDVSPKSLRRWRKAQRREGRCFASPWRIALMILGFIVWWPIGLALLALNLIRRSDMASAFPWTAPWTAPWRDRMRDALPRAGSGNVAFDEHRAAVLARLEEERRQLDTQQAEFADFLRQLRRAKDQEEFDRFMEQRGQSR